MKGMDSSLLYLSVISIWRWVKDNLQDREMPRLEVQIAACNGYISQKHIEVDNMMNFRRSLCLILFMIYEVPDSMVSDF